MKYQRGLKPAELQMLEEAVVSRRPGGTRRLKVIAVWTMLLIVTAVIFSFYSEQKAIKILAIAVILYIAIGIWVMIEEQVKFQQLERSINSVKEKNIVTAIKVESDRFYLIEETEDEGDYYIYQLPDNRMLLFGGQDFYPSDNFPNNRFEIVEARGIKGEYVLRDIFTEGDRIEALRVFSGDEKQALLDCSGFPDPQEMLITEGNIDEYVRKITRQA